MSTLITADIHVVDKPEEAYRLKLLPWLKMKAVQLGCREVCFLGDMTDAKDRHGSVLVNAFVDHVCDLAEAVDVYFLKGNHDAYDLNHPFFRFLNKMRNTSRRIRFITKPESYSLSIGDCLFIPHTKDFEATLNGIKDWWLYPYIFTHQTYDGSKAENGSALPGLNPSIFARKGFDGQVWSGDIHVPQRVSPLISYVGAPYRVHFGDRYEPRVLLINDNGTTKNLHYPAPMKQQLTVDSLASLKKRSKEIYELDLVKINVQLMRRDYPDWQRIRQEIVDYALNQGWVLAGVKLQPLEVVRNVVQLKGKQDTRNPRETLLNHARKQRIERSVIDVGLELLEAVSK